MTALDPECVSVCGEELMQGTYLRFYMHEGVRHHHVLLYQWLLQHARRMGIHGGSAFRAIEGFGRHGVLHAQHFFELAGELTVEVEFILTNELAEQLLASLRLEKLSLIYARCPAEFGVIGAADELSAPESALS